MAARLPNGTIVPIMFDIVFIARARTELAIFGGAPGLAGLPTAVYVAESALANWLVERTPH